MGLKVHAQYALMGQYDFLSLIEAPDEKMMAKAAIMLAARGHDAHHDAAGDTPTRAGRRALLARAAGLAAAGLAIDPARTGELLAAVQLAAQPVDWMWSGAITSGSARIRARVTIDGPVRMLLTRADERDAASPHRIAPTGPRRPTASTPSTPTAWSPTPRTATPSRRQPAARAHRPAPHLRRRAVLVRLRLRLVRDDRVEQRDLRRHPRAQAALLPAPRRLPLRQHQRRRSVAFPRRLEPRAALAAPGGALSRGADRLRLRRPRLRPRRCGRHVGDEGGGAAGLPRARAPLSDAVVGCAARVPGAGPLGPIAQAFTVGRARFIVTDTRSERTPPASADAASRTMLGHPQRQWFVDELTRAADEKAPVVFWGNSVPWITKEDAGSGQGWEPDARSAPKSPAPSRSWA